ncbi:hypothetical protein ACQEU3_21535 [Spirillospora sp. CA-253888]
MSATERAPDGGAEPRLELLPPPVPAERIAELVAEIERVADLLRGGGPAAAEAVAAFNEATAGDYGPLDFTEYHGHRDLADFAREAARPSRPRVPDVTPAELAELVRRIMAADPETGYYLTLLETNVPHPRVSDLVFHPPDDLADASPEENVEAALAHRPIAL